MTKVEYKKASGPLSEYAEKARKGPIIVVKRGKPFAAVVPIRNADDETVALSTNRKFLKIIDRSRARVKKRGWYFGQRIAPSPRSSEIAAHFDVLRILKTCKSPPKGGASEHDHEHGLSSPRSRLYPNQTPASGLKPHALLGYDNCFAIRTSRTRSRHFLPTHASGLEPHAFLS
jgi:prevent-host-death family protein